MRGEGGAVNACNHKSQKRIKPFYFHPSEARFPPRYIRFLLFFKPMSKLSLVAIEARHPRRELSVPPPSPFSLFINEFWPTAAGFGWSTNENTVLLSFRLLASSLFLSPLVAKFDPSDMCMHMCIVPSLYILLNFFPFSLFYLDSFSPACRF